MNVKLRLIITDDGGESFMGIGLLWLLQGIQKHKSIQRAAKKMGLSYPKALKILNHLERKLGRPLLIRKRGGQERGGAVLTPFAERFIAEYNRLHFRVEAYAEKEFARFKKAMEREGGGTRGRKRWSNGVME
jgi:molybdate transport system regulatory protein